MGVNVGSFAAPLICGYLGDTGDPHDFKWGFLAAGIMTLFTVVLFETQKNKYLFLLPENRLVLSPMLNVKERRQGRPYLTPEDGQTHQST